MQYFNLKRFSKTIFSLFVVAILFSTSIYAQEESGESEESELISGNINESGDQIVKIGLMVTIPNNFDGTLKIGGAGELGYYRFLNQYFALGGEVSFGYNPTIGKNVFTYVPFTFNAFFQPTLKSFEFPISAGIGMATESYLNKKYFPALVLKGGIGAFYRVTSSWSFGVNGEFMLLPQWYSDSKHNFCGTFSSVVLSARYHF